MRSLPWKKLALPFAFFAVTAIAAVIYLFHYVSINPQYDNQGLWNGAELLQAIRIGQVGTFLLMVHKYPLFYMLHYTAAFGVAPQLSSWAAFFIGRLVTFAYACGVVALLARLARKTGAGMDAVILLLTSILFLMFASAIRPHVPVTFWTLAAFASALRMRERRTIANTVLSFGCALLAFCTLQNGLLAFIFPVWAYLDGRWSVKHALLAAAWLVGCLVVAVPLGYPILVSGLLGVHNDVGIDLGHNVGLHFSLARGGLVLTQLIGSGPFLFLFGLAGIALLLRDRKRIEAWQIPLLAYLAVFTAIFLFHTSSTSRFFLPTLPMLALFGTYALRACPAWVRSAMLVLVTVVFARFAWLATLPNTYQQASSYLSEQAGTIVAIGPPSYFYELPQDRFASTDEDILGAAFIVMAKEMKKDMVAPWHVCKEFTASTATDEIVLVWNDTPWAYLEALHARAFGPNLSVFCRAPDGSVDL